MKQIIISAIASALSVLMIPPAMSRAQRVYIPEQVRQEYVLVIEEPANKQTIRLLHEGNILQVPMQEYLCGVVLCEMPATFNLEAMKAQAVAARTFTCRQVGKGKHPQADVCSSSACCQAWASDVQLQDKLGESFDSAHEKAHKAVMATHDEVLVYDGALIEATYFSCAGGRTEPAVAVWGSDVPYLQAVDSYGEEDALRYESEVVCTLDEFCTSLENQGAVLAECPSEWVGEIVRSDGGGVQSVVLGGKSFTGMQVRSLFGLNSTKFDITIGRDAVTFSVLGFGHGVGMSQYGADYMAEQGYSYRTILPYYYKGAEIKRLSQTNLGQL